MAFVNVPPLYMTFPAREWEMKRGTAPQLRRGCIEFCENLGDVIIEFHIPTLRLDYKESQQPTRSAAQDHEFQGGSRGILSR